MSRRWVAVAVALGLGAVSAAAHEERLLAGRVEVVQPERKLLVVSADAGGRRQRLEINAETGVLVCRTGRGLERLAPGAAVRISYAERTGARPEALSILVLRQP